MEAINTMEAMDEEDGAGLTAAFGRFYKVSDLASLMKVSVGVLYAAISSGDLEAVSVGGSRGALRVGHANFADYLQRRSTRVLVAS